MADTIVVTGGAGFVGRATVAAAQADGSNVVSVDHRWASAEDLRSRLRHVQIDRCIHLGWYAKPQDYLSNVTANVNSLLSTLELAEYLGSSTACGHLLTIGSSAEYAPSGHKLQETDPSSPRSVYGAAKASAWLLLRSGMLPSSLKLAWGRIFNVTGPGEAAARIVPAVARAAILGKPIALTDGTQVRDYLDVRDVGTALAHLSRVRFEGVANVSSGEPLILRDLLGGIATELGEPGVLGWGQRARSSTDPAYVVGDNLVLRRTGWRRRVDQNQMIGDAANYWKNTLSTPPHSAGRATSA